MNLPKQYLVYSCDGMLIDHTDDRREAQRFVAEGAPQYPRQLYVRVPATCLEKARPEQTHAPFHLLKTNGVVEGRFQTQAEAETYARDNPARGPFTLHELVPLASLPGLPPRPTATLDDRRGCRYNPTLDRVEYQTPYGAWFSFSLCQSTDWALALKLKADTEAWVAAGGVCA